MSNFNEINHSHESNKTNMAKVTNEADSISQAHQNMLVNNDLHTPHLRLDDTFPQVSEVVSPASSTSTSQFLQTMTPLNNNDVMTNTSNPGNDEYALANFRQPPKITPLEEHIKHNEFFNEMTMENEILSNKIAELSNSLPAGVKELDNKAITKFKKPMKKVPNNASKRPAFVVKLWEIINDPKNKDYITWLPKGDALQVLNVDQFVKVILPKYYKQSNFASFVRQLNMYGWHKIQDVTAGSMGQTQDVWQFENPNFRKGREDLLDNIVRKKKGEEDDTDVRKVLEQLEQLKRNQLLITEDLRRVRQDNELLWKESFIARERHKIQSETLDKIMRFLASIYGNNTSKLIERMNSSNPGDLVQFAGNMQNANQYGMYNNSNVHNNMNNNLSPSMNNAMMVSNQYQQHPHPQSNRLNNYNKHNYNQPNKTRDINRSSTSNGHFVQTPSQYQNMDSPMQYTNPRQHLMITNNDGSSAGSTPSSRRAPNELRIKNTGLEPSVSENKDSSIREIHRGPENRNTDNGAYVQHIPDYVDTPRQFSDYSEQQPANNVKREFMNPPVYSTARSSRYDGYDGNSSSYQTSSSASKSTILPITKVQSNTNIGVDSPNDILLAESVNSISSPSLASFTNLNSMNQKTGEFQNPAKTTDIMGNINSQLRKNQGALKQVNDWLTKYNEDPDNDIPPIDDFQVDDFLQQPLDMSAGATPLDIGNVEQFMNTETPAVTPMMTMDDNLFLDKKRGSNGDLIDAGNDISDLSLGQPAKKFKPS